MINNMCIFDHPVKSFMESNFTCMDFSKIKINDCLDSKVRNLYDLCIGLGLSYPTVKTNETEVSLKYDCDNRFVTFIINEADIHFTYGTLGKKSISNIITDTDKQLKILNKFLYQGLN
jgi:hypothetical protein